MLMLISSSRIFIAYSSREPYEFWTRRCSCWSQSPWQLQCLYQSREGKPLLTTFVHPIELNTIFIEICFRVSIEGSLVSRVVIAEGKAFKKYTQCLEMWGPVYNYPITSPPPTPPTFFQIKLLVCEIWKRHVVVQFVQYSLQVGCRYASPQWLKNEWRRAGWLWWTSPLRALSFFSVWLPWLPRGQRAANLSYWSEAALRFLLTTTANEQTDWGASEFTRSTLSLPELLHDHTAHPPAHQRI